MDRQERKARMQCSQANKHNERNVLTEKRMDSNTK
jgi:hypothetical protein